MNTMKRAWEIANDAVNKFGGKAKDYFNNALKLAWKELKTGKKLVKTAKVTMFQVLEKFADKAMETIGKDNFNPDVYVTGQLQQIGKDEVLNGFFEELENTVGWRIIVANRGDKLETLFQKLNEAVSMLDAWMNGRKPAISYNK